jgi:hypothetical protein
VTSRTKSIKGLADGADVDACSVCGGRCGEMGRRFKGVRAGRGRDKGGGRGEPDGEQLLLFTCDGNCGSYFHPCCVDLAAPPEDGEWFCKQCTAAAKGAAEGNGRGRGRTGNSNTGLGGLDLKAVARDLLALKAELVGMKREKQALEARWRIERQLNASMDVRKVESRKKMNTELATLKVEVAELRETNVEMLSEREEWKEAIGAKLREKAAKEQELERQRAKSAREQQLQQQLDSRDDEVLMLRERLRDYEVQTHAHSAARGTAQAMENAPGLLPEAEALAGGGGTSAARSLAHARARARTSLAQQPATSPTPPSRLTRTSSDSGFVLQPLQMDAGSVDGSAAGNEAVGRAVSVPVGSARSPTVKQSMLEATAPRMASSPTHMMGGRASDLPWPMPKPDRRHTHNTGYEVPKSATKNSGGARMAPTSPLLSTRTLNNASLNNTMPTSGFPLPMGSGGHGLARPSTAGERAQAMKARLHSLLDSLQD